MGDLNAYTYKNNNQIRLDIDGSSKLYSLSDFNIHSTANIENGYLNGRYGGIPFLSKLND